MDECHSDIIEHNGKLLWMRLDGCVRATDLISECVTESTSTRVVPSKRQCDISLGSSPNEQARHHPPRVFNS